MNKRTESGSKAGFVQKMSLMDSVFLVVGGVVGSGIFMTTGFIAEFVPSVFMVLIVWLVGGIITLCGGLSFGELGSMFPKAGGQFVYLKEAYGDWAGFLFGWTFFWVIECGGIAALAVGFAEYAGYFLPGLSPQASLVKGEIVGFPFSLSAGQFVAVGSVAVLSAINYLGIKSGIFVQNLFTFLRIGLLAAIVLGGLFVGSKSGIRDLSQFFASAGPLNFKFMGLALFAVIWTYDGWYSVSCTAEEIKNPKRNIPLSLFLGTAAITIIYLLVNIVYVMTVPIERMKGVARVGEMVASSLFGHQGAFLIAAGITVTIFGCLSATILYGPRVYYAMAEERLFFKRMSFIHPRFRVPTTAIIWQAVWSSLLCLSGTYQTLYEYVIFAVVLFFAATGAAVIILRIRQPEKLRPYRTWGYPIVPSVFILVNLAIFLNSILSQPFESAIGLGIILAGAPAYIFWRKRKTATPGLEKM
ncbi:MAG: amino acid permease [Clostridiales bacterium]|nr:amino acid permease [Clostridiales bacterium]